MKRTRETYGSSCTTIMIGSDHAGYALKSQIIEHLRAAHKNITVRDFGTTSDTARVDYPDVARAVCGAVLSAGPTARGILLDGAGVASGMAANKIRGVRCAVANDLFSVKMGRQHNDANVLSLGGKLIGEMLAKEIVDAFVTLAFEGERHIPRLEKLEALEDEAAGVAGGGGAGVPRFSLGGTAGAVSPFKLAK